MLRCITKKKRSFQMSEEKTVTEAKKSTGLFGWIKNIVSAVVGAAISFGVTLGVVSADQEKQMNEKMNNINVKAEQVVTALKAKDVNGAIEKAQEIVADTKVVVETAKEAVEETKEKIEKKVEEVKDTAAKAKQDITKAVESKDTTSKK